MSRPIRNLLLILGDQLNRDSAVFDDFDPEHDAVWMAEVEQEACYVRSHKRRIALFFAAMRHFRDALQAEGVQVRYHALTPRRSEDRGPDLAAVLGKDVRALGPERLVLVMPGDWRVLQALRQQAEATGVPLTLRPDRHFYCSIEEFRTWATGRKELVLEHFYRWMRKRESVLLHADGSPLGGRWNFDADNRETFGARGPEGVEATRERFAPDALTREVIDIVERRYRSHPGSLAHFDLPVTPDDARAALDDFVTHRLPRFGTYQDAMWAGQPFLYHSRLSTALNLHLLDPREAVRAAVAAYERGAAPLNSVEGFVRQVLGWREFVRGVYWTHMPQYAGRNALRCRQTDVPRCFWDGDTDMRCVADAMSQLTRYAYAHHIQRLMVFGLFAQLQGVHPWKFHEWHMAMYADAVDWVSLPNTLGMSQYADGGIVGSKPYCASGAYIHRMSNYCADCRYDHRRAAGETACPFTTLYWDFLARHRKRFADNRRMVFQVRNLERKSPRELREIRSHARTLRRRLRTGERV